jgi:curved DNA-binding protein CbpA
MATTVDALANRRVNLYEVLQVSPRAGQEVIQAAYRVLARTYHPDVNAAPDAARQMRQLNAAYGVLSDPERRARYDMLRLRPARARGAVGVDEETVANAASSAAATARPRPSYIRAVPPVAPPAPPSSPRLGRLIAVLGFMVFLIVAAVYGLWLIAGALDDEPTRSMAPMSPEVAQSADASSTSLFSVPSDILSSALSHNDGPQPMGR